MIKREVMEDVLLKIGIPANLDGFNYVADAIEIMEKESTKITTMYDEIGKKYETKGRNVERSIRHAFQVARECKNGLHDDVEHYIGFSNMTNASSLARLLLMVKREVLKNERN